ncbi:MAG: cobalamin biosynthesis protein CbiM [Thermoprotei archaeon]|nr:MAG: cobalamin biosynthesis protein CbiM [Thermoprotei archaeon]
MHIPDGFLTVNTWGPCWLVSFFGLGYCIKKTKEVLRDRMVPLMGIMAAFIFSAQMLNFPIAGGTSGHLLGGVLAAILLGPYAGAIVIAVVLTAQCFIFQDGGVTALGANIFNMSFIPAFFGYFIYNITKNIVKKDKGIVIGAGVASWLSVVIASGVCALELAISETSPLKIALPAMVSVHVLIGIGEAIITCLVIGFVLKVRPDLIYNK